MKKLLLLSGVITGFLLVWVLTGVADADDVVKNALKQGNMQYESSEYGEAIRAYGEGLTVDPESIALNHNAAQAAYLLGEYEQAFSYYDKSDDSIESFLNQGNASFKLGGAASDGEQMLKFYNAALEIYRDGIIKYPQDVSLKYNYETVKEKIEELTSNSEQESNDQSGQGEEQESGEEQEGQEQESDENESGRGDQQESGQESGKESGKQEGQEQEDNQEQDAGQSQGEEQPEGGEEQTASGQDNQDEGEQEAYGQDEGEEGEDGQKADSQEEIEADVDWEAIERILRMLENQEEESLKNNQSVVGGKEGKYDW